MSTSTTSTSTDSNNKTQNTCTNTSSQEHTNKLVDLKYKFEISSESPDIHRYLNIDLLTSSKIKQSLLPEDIFKLAKAMFIAEEMRCVVEEDFCVNILNYVDDLIKLVKQQTQFKSIQRGEIQGELIALGQYAGFARAANFERQYFYDDKLISCIAAYIIARVQIAILTKNKEEFKEAYEIFTEWYDKLVEKSKDLKPIHKHKGSCIAPYNIPMVERDIEKLEKKAKQFSEIAKKM